MYYMVQLLHVDHCRKVCQYMCVLMVITCQIATPASATNKYVVHLPPTHGDTSGSSTSHSFSPGGGLGLATPTTASQGEGKEGVCPPLSSSLSSSRQSVVVKRLSVNIHRKSTDTTSHDGEGSITEQCVL